MILDATKKENILLAAEKIKSGELVAFPTETVYGLGADAFNLTAVKKIFEAKGRPFNDPLILHIADQTQLNDIVEHVSPLALKLIERFWPGPLTLIFDKTSKVDDLLTAKLKTVAVRMPRNIIALALIRNSHTIIAAPSANKFQGISPTNAQDVEKEIGDILILDGGNSLIGLESTIVDCRYGLKILRRGAISVEEINECCGMKAVVTHSAVQAGQSLVAPGMLDFHYAPKKNLIYLNEDEIWVIGKNIIEGSAVICFSEKQKDLLKTKGFKDVHMLSPKADLQEAARNYYKLLRQLDEGSNNKIICLELLEEGLGSTINDRMRKAHHK